MMTPKIRLSVIVLLYKGDTWINTCVSSLENQSLNSDHYEIILVDNGGHTPSVKKYKEHNRIKTIIFPVNYGFAGGYNQALNYANGKIILLMNQDVLVHHRCLEEIIRAFDSRPEAGVISANMLMVSKNDAIDPFDQNIKKIGYYKLSHYGYASYVFARANKGLFPVEFVSGNALGFRKIILKDIGNQLFDSYLVSYAEDLDLSIRIKKTKWKMYICPKAVVYHFRDEAFTGNALHRLRKLSHISSNRLLVYYKHLDIVAFLKKLPCLLLGIPLKVGRLDREAHFNAKRFMGALILLPFIFIYFIKRLSGRK
jgi:GT2 family glycosyltransferase